MTTLYITEYSALATLPAGQGQMPLEPPVAEQTVTIGASSAQSAVFHNSTRFVRLHADSICSVEFGASPTAASTNGRLSANQTEYRAVPVGGTLRVAVITNT